MAQWLGQYTGRTHESKAREIETSLCKAVDALRKATEQEKTRKVKAVRRLSERLLRARHKMLHARISNLTEARAPGEVSQKIAHLKAQEQEMSEQGIAGILKEFGVTEPTDAEVENDPIRSNTT